MFGTRKLGKKLKNKSVRTMMHLKWVFWDIVNYRVALTRLKITKYEVANVNVEVSD